ncbi:hypothetical protein ACSBR2_016738 [Camellia fascicularis]
MRITKVILDSVTEQPCSFTTLEQVKSKLNQALAGKKFLIVLDDVWSKKYSYWEDFKSPFSFGAQGSKILVTTRDEAVATMMGSVELHKVECLLYKDCWLLFEQLAFENRSIDANPNLVSIGEKIVEKCKGLPLAIKTLGGLLKSKVRDKEWEDVLQNEIWELSDDENDILPALRLSYHHLPPHLKQCFAYCSIIPKGYEFEEEELVLLWMAEGFIQQQRKKQMEDVGGEYFWELLSRSFFQPSSTGKGSKFVMHDLINDLAHVVARDTCFRLDDKLKDQEQYKNLKKARHSSYMQEYYEGADAVKELPLGIDDSQDGRAEKEVLDMLRPHKNLKELHIKGYLGTGFPTWIGDPLFSNMADLSLDNCGNCASLPPLGQLPSLKKLYIKGMSVLKHVGCAFYGQGKCSHFAQRDNISLVWSWIESWIAESCLVTLTVQTSHSYGDIMLLAKASESKQIFGVLDVEKKGKITFKQFLYGSAHVLQQPFSDEPCELAFIECHTGENHYISEQELGDYIKAAIPNMDEFEIHELFKSFDTDSDGRINKDDFIACLRRNPLLVALFSLQLMHNNLSGVNDT